jgi:hypothetical protein
MICRHFSAQTGIAWQSGMQRSADRGGDTAWSFKLLK